ncbi:MAG: alpha/beta hydrolase [Acidobacteriia bacterium]|nr:alpha/beta hydrolase [Terriglobia bacterium]
MSVFCLVHGSAQSAEGWNLLVPELEKRGHAVIRPTLPADTRDASATHYARIIADSIPNDVHEAIVVAHSASCAFLPLVAEIRHVSRIVFLAGVIPQIGTSILGQIQADPTLMNPAWIGKNPVTDDDVAREFLFHDCSPEVQDWALTTRRLMFAVRAMTETCPLEKWPDVPASYIVCADDRTVQPEWSRRAARERLGIEAIELPGGHCPYVSRPAELARVLTELA